MIVIPSPGQDFVHQQPINERPQQGFDDPPQVSQHQLLLTHRQLAEDNLLKEASAFPEKNDVFFELSYHHWIAGRCH